MRAPGRCTHPIAAPAAALLAVALVAAACGGGVKTHASTTIPQSAFSNSTGVTSTSIEVGNVSSDSPYTFFGAEAGVQGYFDMINTLGGVHGRKLYMDARNDATSNPEGSTLANKELTEESMAKDFAMVGNFSLADGQGGGQDVLGANPGFPDVSVGLGADLNALPNVISPVPAELGWELGPLEYFKAQYPQAVHAVGAVIGDVGTAVAQWNSERAAMEHAGYDVIQDPTYSVTEQDFGPIAQSFKDAGVKMVFLDESSWQYTPKILTAFSNDNFHPVIVLGASSYDQGLISGNGVFAGAGALANGVYLEQNASLYLSADDAAAIPMDGLFQTWSEKAATQLGFSSFHPDLFTMYGWVSAELFVQALLAAGTNPTRGSLLQALRGITSFNAQGMIAPDDPAAKTLKNCYVIAQIENGQFQRLAGVDPPYSDNNGYRCDYSYYHASAS